MEGKTKRILMTTDPLGGVWNYTLRLCRSLQPYGVEVHLASMGAPLSSSQKDAALNLTNVRLYESTFPLEWMNDPWKGVDEALLWLEGIYREVKPDLMHFNNFGQVDHLWECPVVTVFHSCVISWWRAVKKTEPSGSEWLTYRKRVKNAMYASDVVIAPTNSMLNEIREIYGRNGHSICIHHGYMEASYSNLVKEPFIFSMGRIWDESKNMRALERLAAAVEWPVYVAGDPVNPVTAEQLQLDNVFFLGKLTEEDTQEWLSRAAIYLQPSRYEPFGLSVLEAARNGCALVLNDILTFRELWQDAACFAEFDDPRDIANTVNILINDANLRVYMSSAAMDKANCYNEVRMTQHYLQVYENMINKLTNQGSVKYIMNNE